MATHLHALAFGRRCVHGEIRAEVKGLGVALEVAFVLADEVRLVRREVLAHFGRHGVLVPVKVLQAVDAFGGVGEQRALVVLDAAHVRDHRSVIRGEVAPRQRLYDCVRRKALQLPRLRGRGGEVGSCGSGGSNACACGRCGAAATPSAPRRV